MIINNTPVEPWTVGNLDIHVKREDLCCPLPGPSFSKMRGVVAHIEKREESVIGVLDTFHSKAGWAVSWACSKLGKTAVDFWPVYKADREDDAFQLRPQQKRAQDLGARLVALPAGRSAILYHQARKQLAAEHPDAYLMPNALKLPESITENATEAVRTVEAGALPPRGPIILSISSGTVASGVLKGLAEADALAGRDIILHMGYSRSIQATRAYMEKMSGLSLDSPRVQFVDEGYGYADAARIAAPFPCNPFYDAKAWAWLMKPEQQERFRGVPITFWNIGD